MQSREVKLADAPFRWRVQPGDRDPQTLPHPQAAAGITGLHGPATRWTRTTPTKEACP